VSESYGLLLRRAIAFAARHPGLWLLGLLVSASGGGGGGDLARIVDRDQIDASPLAPFLGAVLVALALLGIVLILLTALAQGALIHAVREEEEGRKPSFTTAVAAGTSRYARVFLLFAVLFVGLFAVLVPLVGVPLLIWKALGSSLLVTIPLVLVLVPPYVLLALATIFVVEWSLRAAVLGERPAFAAITEAVGALRHGAGRSLTLVVGSLFNEVLALIVLLVAAIPFTVAALAAAAIDPLLVLVPGAPFVAFLLAYLGLKGTFTSAFWTYAYMAQRTARGASDAWGESGGGI
jgi:hypothetical protein